MSITSIGNATLIIGDAQDIREFLCGPIQHSEHCKAWRWHMYVQDDAKRFAAVMAEQRQMAEEYRAKIPVLEQGTYPPLDGRALRGTLNREFNSPDRGQLTSQQRADILLAEYQSQREAAE